MTKQSRPRGSSRAPAPRPRRIAGRGPATTGPATTGPATTGPATTGPVDQAGQVEEVDQVERAERAAEPETPEPPEEPVEEPVEEPAGRAGSDAPSYDDAAPAAEPAPSPSLFAGSRVTRVLLALVVVLTLATLGMAGYLWLKDEDPAGPARVREGEIAVPADRPIQLPWSDAQAAAEKAAESATVALATSWEDYDEQLDEAAALMTPAFGEKFRTTATDARAGVLEGKVEIAVRVVAQSVVRANTSQVQAMLFLDQYTTKQGEQEGTTVSPYRVLVTLVNTDGGWLISDLQTR